MAQIFRASYMTKKVKEEVILQVAAQIVFASRNRREVDDFLKSSQRVATLIDFWRVRYGVKKNDLASLRLADRLLANANFKVSVKDALSVKEEKSSWQVRVTLRTSLTPILKDEYEPEADFNGDDGASGTFLPKRYWKSQRKPAGTIAPLRDETGRVYKKFPNFLIKKRGLTKRRQTRYVHNNCAHNTIATVIQHAALKAEDFMMDMTENARMSGKYDSVARVVKSFSQCPHHLTFNAEKGRRDTILDLRYHVDRTERDSNKANVFGWTDDIYELQTCDGVISCCEDCDLKTDKTHLPNLRYSDFARLANLQLPDGIDIKSYNFYCTRCKEYTDHKMHFYLRRSGFAVDLKDLVNNPRSASIRYSLQRCAVPQLCHLGDGDANFKLLGFACSMYGRGRNPTHVKYMTWSVPQEIIEDPPNDQVIWNLGDLRQLCDSEPEHMDTPYDDVAEADGPEEHEVPKNQITMLFYAAV